MGRRRPTNIIQDIFPDTESEASFGSSSSSRKSSVSSISTEKSYESIPQYDSDFDNEELLTEWNEQPGIAQPRQPYIEPPPKFINDPLQTTFPVADLGRNIDNLFNKNKHSKALVNKVLETKKEEKYTEDQWDYLWEYYKKGTDTQSLDDIYTEKVDNYTFDVFSSIAEVLSEKVQSS